ncbi:hypothetical protein CB1_000831002 [Camelus ferus]|nr:hypothetical protein CB1_000831002 [Camelus ferus]
MGARPSPQSTGPQMEKGPEGDQAAGVGREQAQNPYDGGDGVDQQTAPPSMDLGPRSPPEQTLTRQNKVNADALQTERLPSPRYLVHTVLHPEQLPDEAPYNTFQCSRTQRHRCQWFRGSEQPLPPPSTPPTPTEATVLAHSPDTTGHPRQ